MVPRICFALAGLAALTACSPIQRDPDAGRPDSGPRDSGVPDSGLDDSGTPDSGAPDAGSPDSGEPDAGPPDGGPNDGGIVGSLCALPGSWVHDATGVHEIPGAIGLPSLAWLNIPLGFCAHHFANVGNARQIRFAPDGDLFVASPTTLTTGGGYGMAEIVVIPDDDHDGLGDYVLTYKDQLPSTQGLLFANGYLYYQDDTRIMRQAHTPGQRAESGVSEKVVDISVYTSSLHWPKTLDISDTGRIFVGNGGDQGESCAQPMPFHGGILEIDGSPNGKQVAMGLRNPIDLKCHRDGNDHCYASELALDYSAEQGGREKLIPIHDGDNWGFPCCATQDLAYSGVMVPCPGDPGNQCPPDCSAIVGDTNSFLIGNTPFGLDFEDTQFPAPWDHRVMVALHGVAGSWAGARIVAIAMDPGTGLPLPSSTVGGGDNGNMSDFATGWDDESRSHGRPADIAFSPDGRMFVASDNDGEIFWIAPVSP